MSYWDSIKEHALSALDQFKKGAQVAADKAGELGRIGALRIEIANLKSKINQNFIHLGSEAYILVREQDQTDIVSNTQVQQYMDQISLLKQEIDAKQAEITSLSEADPTPSE